MTPACTVKDERDQKKGKIPVGICFCMWNKCTSLPTVQTELLGKKQCEVFWGVFSFKEWSSSFQLHPFSRQALISVSLASLTAPVSMTTSCCEHAGCCAFVPALAPRWSTAAGEVKVHHGLVVAVGCWAWGSAAAGHCRSGGLVPCFSASAWQEEVELWAGSAGPQSPPHSWLGCDCAGGRWVAAVGLLGQGGAGSLSTPSTPLSEKLPKLVFCSISLQWRLKQLSVVNFKSKRKHSK